MTRILVMRVPRNIRMHWYMWAIVCVRQDSLRLRMLMRKLWDWGEFMGMIRVRWVYRIGGGLLENLSRGSSVEYDIFRCALTDESRNSWKRSVFR
jgi:hypothetical protein